MLDIKNRYKISDFRFERRMDAEAIFDRINCGIDMYSYSLLLLIWTNDDELLDDLDKHRFSYMFTQAFEPGEFAKKYRIIRHRDGYAIEGH